MKGKDNGTLDIVVDGYYCKKCNEWHPQLFWHESFIDRFEKERWIERHMRAMERFGSACTDEQAEMHFYHSLSMCDLKIHPDEHTCHICSSPTYFSNLRTNHFVCSVKCRYSDDH